MFSTVASAQHSSRKRILSNVYAKSTLHSSVPLTAAAKVLILDRFLPRIEALHGAPTDCYELIASTTMDLVTSYQFGLQNCFDFLRRPDEARQWFHQYDSRRSLTFWPQELPNLTAWLARIGINVYGAWVNGANYDLEDNSNQHCKRAHAVLDHETAIPAQDVPSVYSQGIQGLHAQREKPNVYPQISDAPVPVQVASDMHDHLAAGHETSAVTLTFLFYELSSRPSLQQQLHHELQTLDRPPIRSPQSPNPSELPSLQALDHLPLLAAVLKETLRRWAAIPGPQPRITPTTPHSHGTTLGPYTHIPAGVRVSSNAYCLHRNPAVFPDPESWDHTRWLPLDASRSAADQQAQATRQREMHRWFWPFSSGGRMCIGSNLALLQMKLIVAAVLTNFQIRRHGIQDGDGRLDERAEAVLEQEDAYTAQPTGRLLVRFVPW